MVLKGRVDLQLGPDLHRLAAGDSATLLPGELRLWVNPGRNLCQVLLIGLVQ